MNMEADELQKIAKNWCLWCSSKYECIVPLNVNIEILDIIKFSTLYITVYSFVFTNAMVPVQSQSLVMVNWLVCNVLHYKIMTSCMICMLASQGGNVTTGSQLVSALSQQGAKQQQSLVNSMDHHQHNNSSSPPSSVSSAPSPLPTAGTTTPSPAQQQQATHQGSILPTLNGPITSKVIIWNSQPGVK